MVEVPVPTTLIDLPEITATFSFEDPKTQGADEFEVGATSGIVPTPYVTLMMGKGPRMVTVAFAGVAETESESASAKIAYTYDFRGRCIFRLSSMFSGLLGCRHT